MRRETFQTSNARKQTKKMMGLIVSAMLLGFSTQLMGKGNDIPPTQPVVQESKTPERVIVLSIPDKKLALMQDGEVVKVYDIAIGKPSTPSPTGEMKVINKVVDPTYYHKGKVVKPGKSNPLGNRWMGLSKVGYGIHGTNVQSSVGKAASHGCFRMRKHDVEELFTLVQVGDAVEIHGERDVQLAAIFGSAETTAQLAALPLNELRVTAPAEVMAASGGL